jgi:hypothetical protein
VSQCLDLVLEVLHKIRGTVTRLHQRSWSLGIIIGIRILTPNETEMLHPGSRIGKPSSVPQSGLLAEMGPRYHSTILTAYKAARRQYFAYDISEFLLAMM